MPHITAAMHRSVRRGVSDIVFDSLLRRQSAVASIEGVKNTFSSWSNCMAKSYCKWPVIIGIIFVSLIVFSVVWCIIRCACCGMSCCCTCFSFLKCFDCCGGCCDGKKDKPMKHLDEPYNPRQGFQNQGYQAPAPMMGGGLGAKPEPPQFAQFEVGKSGLAVDRTQLSEDALPPMPSWDNASKKHVLTEEEKQAVELGELDPVTGQKVPLMAGAVSPALGGPPSPAHDMNASPYGVRPGQGGGGNGYMGVAAGDPYGPPAAYNQNGYRGPPSPGPGRGMGGPGRGYGQSPPVDGQGRGYPPPQDQYANDGFSAAPVGYGRPQPQRQNSNDTYGSRQPQRQDPNDTYGSRQYPPQPQRGYSDDSSRPLNPGRQYSDQPYGSDNFQPSGPPRGPSRGPGPGPGPRGPGRMASPPLANNAGFEFGSGGQQAYSRPSNAPQQMPYGPSQGSRPSPPPQQGGYFGGTTAPPSYASRSPPPQEPSYPGYQAYQPPTQGGRGPPGGRAREPPQNWDPVQR